MRSRMILTELLCASCNRVCSSPSRGLCGLSMVIVFEYASERADRRSLNSCFLQSRIHLSRSLDCVNKWTTTAAMNPETIGLTQTALDLIEFHVSCMARLSTTLYSHDRSF